MNSMNPSSFVHKDDKQGIPGSTIKLIAIIAMLIDHIAATILYQVIISHGFGAVINGGTVKNFSYLSFDGVLVIIYILMRLIGRFGFPIFCFLLIDGFKYTHNRFRYALRLFLFALISEVPFDLAFTGLYCYKYYQNVFFTLFIGLITLCGYEYLAKMIRSSRVVKAISVIAGVIIPSLYLALVVYNSALKLFGSETTFLSDRQGLFFTGAAVIAGIIILIAFLLYRNERGTDCAVIFLGDFAILSLASLIADNLRTDYSGIGILTITFMYLFRNKKVSEMVAGCAVLTALNPTEASAFFMVPVIAKYNGKRGWNMKYLFYAFYPVHLALLYLICLSFGYY